MGYDAERAEDDWHAASRRRRAEALREIDEWEREGPGMDETEELVMGGDFDGSAYQSGSPVEACPQPSNADFQEFLLSPTGAFQRIADRVVAAYTHHGTITGRFISSPIEEVEKNMSRKDVILSRMKQLEAEMAELAKLPDEPTVPDSPFPPVIFFVKQFPGTEVEYTYLFFKAPHDGLWYGTGVRQSGRPMTWDDLMEWLKGSGPMPVIYKLAGYEEYFAPEESE